MNFEQETERTIDLIETEKISRIVQKQKEYFAGGATRSLKFRRERLTEFGLALNVFERKLVSALKEDLGKSAFESCETELLVVREELRFALAHMEGWNRSRRVRTPITLFPASSRIYRDSLGSVLILAPWNYPVNLSLTPLISALAAGNCAVVKPSGSAPAVAEVLAELIGTTFDPAYAALIKPGENVNSNLLKQSFDHIFFTGSKEVGKTVMKAASERLIPVTLELGGKSPCIVDETAHIDLAARRIAWGKCVNAGQTCVAPDYVLAAEEVREPLIAAVKKYMLAFYGSDPTKNADLPRIVNRKHFDRLSGLLSGQEIVFGGGRNEETGKIEPTILLEPDPESPVMQEEIFGPILPVLSFRKFEDALEFVREREKPLALYLFTENRRRVRKTIHSVPFGGGCVNDTLIHLSNPRLPFGGAGESGMGAYHGRRGFETFSREKSVITQSGMIDIPLRYPPYRGKARWLSLFMKRP